MPTVTIDTVRLERLQVYARLMHEQVSLDWYQLNSAEDWNARCRLYLGDLDPVEPVEPAEPVATNGYHATKEGDKEF